jgi:cell division protein FtsL
MSVSDAEVALARLQAQRGQIQQALSQLERQIAQQRLQVVTIEQRIARLTRSQRPAA